MKEYILAVDVGNTNTVFGLIGRDGEHKIEHRWRTVTRRERTSDELGIFLLGFLATADIKASAVTGVIYSSVMPAFNPIVERMVHTYFDCDPVVVSHQNVPITISYPVPEEIGADRLVNSVAGHFIYGGDLIIIDLGTATTFCVMHEGDYMGGSIAPGLKLSMESLIQRTAKLPQIEFSRPASGVIGDSTVHAMQSGFFYGWVGMLKGIKDEIIRSYPERNYKIIATGGLSNLIKDEAPDLFDVVDPDLTLKGLLYIFFKAW